MKLPFEMRGGMLLVINSFAVLLLAFPVQVVVARYLGPSQQGEYAYILSFAAFARAFVNLNLQDVLIPLYKKDPEDAWFGSGLLLRQTASISLSLGVAGWTMLQHWQGSATSQEFGLMVFVTVAAYLFSDHEIYTIWCKCQGRLVDFVAVDFLGTLVGLGLRLAAVYQGATLVALLVTYLLEQVAKLLIAVCLYFYRGRPLLKPFRASRERYQQLFRRAWPLWLSALLTVGYTRLDQMLLGTLLSDPSELGQYSVSVRIFEALSAGALALFIIYLPILSSNTGEAFERHLQRQQDLALGGSLLLVGSLALIIKPLIEGLYGSRYSVAAQLCQMSLWLVPVVYLNFCRSSYLFSKGLQKFELVLKIISLSISLVVNWQLIPRYGAKGSVMASLFVQWGVLLGSYLFLKELRPLGRSALRAANLFASGVRLRNWLVEHK